MTPERRKEGDNETPVCPRCGGPVSSWPTCHTWPRTSGDKTTWMSCMPCDSAVNWYCVAGEDEDGCGWDWTDGLNPGNPRSVENDQHAPPWAASVSPVGKTTP